jgi:glucoamylase
MSIIPPGAPGIEPRWTSSAKDGLGTAYHTSSRLWFTLSHGIVNEAYYPYVDTPNTRDLKRGGPTGSAMPLCWAHAEYVSLVRSRHDGVDFDRIEPVYQRYAKARQGGKMEMWTFAHQPQRIGKGKELRIIAEQAAKIHWSFDGWATANDLETRAGGLGMHWADLPTDKLPDGTRVVFTFNWVEANRWEGRNFSTLIDGTGRTSA